MVVVAVVVGCTGMLYHFGKPPTPMRFNMDSNQHKIVGYRNRVLFRSMPGLVCFAGRNDWTRLVRPPISDGRWGWIGGSMPNTGLEYSSEYSSVYSVYESSDARLSL